MNEEGIFMDSLVCNAAKKEATKAKLIEFMEQNDIAYNLQKKVKNSVESYAGLDNITVNVFVDGIENENAPKEDKEDEEGK